jgi:hypothetical protein
MLNVGRPASLEEQLGTIQQQIDKARGPFDPSAFGGNAAARAQLPDLKDQESRLRRMLEITNGNATAQAQVAEQTKATVEFDKLGEQSLSRQEKLHREIAKARALGLQAGASQAEIDKVIAGISYETSKLGIEAQIEHLQAVQQVLEVRTKSLLADLDAQRRMGLINERAYIEQSADAEIAAMEKRRASLEQQLALKAKERDSEKEVAGLRGQVDLADEQIAARRQQRGRDVLVYMDAQAKAIYAVIRAEQEQFQQEKAMEDVAASKRMEQALLTQYDYARAVKDANEQVDFEASLLGKSAEQMAKLNEQRRIELQLRDQKRRIDDQARGGNLTAAEVEELNTAAEDTAAKAIAKVDTKAYIDKWKTVNDAVGEGLYDALTRQGTSARDRLKRLFGDLVLRPILAPVSAGITNFIMGGSGSAGSAGAGAMGGAGGGLNLNNLSGLSNMIGGSSGYTGMLANGASALGMSNVAAGLSGVGGSYASTVGAGLATDAMGATVAEGTAAATIGSAGATAGAAVAAAIPVIGWVIAIAGILYSVFGKKGGAPKQEGYYNPYNADKYYSSNGGQVTIASKTAANALQAQYDAMVGAFGGMSALRFGLGYSTDPGGDAENQAQVGAGIGGVSQFNFSRSDAGHSQEELQAAIGELGARAMLKGLQMAGLDGVIGDYLKTLADAATLSAARVTEAIARIQKAAQEKVALDESWYQLTHSDAEKLARTRERELDALDLSNKAMAVRIYALQDEISAQQKAQAAYSDAAAAINQMKDSVTAFLDKLNATPAGLGSPETQLTNARSQFDAQMALAKGGNRTAIEGITGYADQLISAQVGYSASGQPTQDTLAYVKQQLAALKQMTPDAAVNGQVSGGMDLINATTAQLIAAAEKKAADQIAAIQAQIEAAKPKPYDDAAYLAANPDVAAAVQAGGFVSGAQHYLHLGQNEGRSLNGMAAPTSDYPVPSGFNAVSYLAKNPDIAADPYWAQHPDQHYFLYGRNENRHWATGGAFTNSVVMGPTAFMSADGRSNVMGEKTAEGVLPLVNIGGKLGVHSVGGAGGNHELVAEVKALKALVARLITVTATVGRSTVDVIATVADNTGASANAMALQRTKPAV